MHFSWRTGHITLTFNFSKRNEAYPTVAAVGIIHEDSKVCQVITKTFCQGAVYYPRFTSLPWPALGTKEKSVNTFTFKLENINYVSWSPWWFVLILMSKTLIVQIERIIFAIWPSCITDRFVCWWCSTNQHSPLFPGVFYLFLGNKKRWGGGGGVWIFSGTTQWKCWKLINHFSKFLLF